MNGDPVQLDYALPPARRWNPRRYVLAAAVIAALWMLVELGPDAVRRVRLIWVQERCARFEFPKDVVIFDSDPVSGAALMADSGNYVAQTDAQVWPRTGVGRREPDCWVSLKGILFGSRSFWPPGPPAPKALVHRLRNSAGVERLVAIIIAPSPPPLPTANPIYPHPAIGVVAAIVQPGTWDVPPRWDGNSVFLRAGFESAQRLRFYSAQLDPNDASRFSIAYEMDGKRGTIDGRLEDDATVSLKVRDGPASKTGE
jgi:hypothetical protein